MYLYHPKRNKNITLKFVLGLILFTVISLYNADCVKAAYQQSGEVGPSLNGAQFPGITGDNQIWIPVYSDNNIRVYNTDGARASFSPITSGQDPSGKVIPVVNPSGLAIYQNTVYVSCDAFVGNRYILRFSSTDGTSVPGYTVFYSVGDLDVDAAGRLFIVEKSGRAIHVLDINGNELPGSPINLPTSYSNYRGIAVTPDSKTIYISSENPGAILKLNGTIEGGKVAYGRVEMFKSGLDRPSAVNYEKDNRIYISESGQNRVLIFTPEGNEVDRINGGNPALNLPRGIAISDEGKTIYIAQFTALPVQKWITSTPVTSTPAVTPSPTLTTARITPSGDGVYHVQVGAFQSQGNAQSMLNYISGLGYTPVKSVVEQGWHRVLVGEFPNQVDAEKIANELNTKVKWAGYNGSYIVTNDLIGVKFVPLPLTATTPSGAPPSATVAREGQQGYWIQIGAYASEQNANAVKEKVAQLGYANVLVAQEPGVNNITLNKVRLGPFASNSDAQRIRQDLIERLVFPGLTGDYWIFTGQVSGAGATPPAPTLAYRVLVAKFSEFVEGARLKAELESKGRYPVYVDNNPPTFDVTVGNYPNEIDAQGLMESLKGAGFLDARIIRAGEVAPPPAVASADQQTIAAREQSASELLEQGRFLEAISQFEDLLRTVQDNARIIRQLQEANEKLTEEQRKRLEEEKTKLAEVESRNRDIQLHNNNALSFYEEGNANAAIEEWEKVLAIDPDNRTALYFLSLAKKTLEALPEPQKKELEQRGETTKELQKMYDDARTKYLTKQYDEALRLYQQIIQTDPNSPQAQLAREAIANIQSEKTEQEKLAKASQRGELMWNIIYGLIGLVVVGGVGFGGYKLMGYIKSRPMKEKLPKPAKVAKAGKEAKGGIGTMIAPPEDHAKDRELSPEQQEKKKQGMEWYQKGMVAMETKNWDEAISCFLTAASLDPNNPEPRGKVERVKLLRREEEKLGEAQKKAMAQAETQVIPPSREQKEETTPTISIARPTPQAAPAATPKPAETTIAATAIPSKSPGSSVFQQNFDDESVGNLPKGWMGEFAHASLQIQDAVTSNNSGKAVKFEKQTGTASTHYRCKFEPIKNKINVEFDLRCDSKNKYFLGVYIESDEDFRKAVHTVIHTTEDGTSASLRLQGEPIPYQLGTWAHIKYVLNLAEASVDAYVNNQQVVKGARIPGTPEMMNTISIRDNPATTAQLYLDNIVITTA